MVFQNKLHVSSKTGIFAVFRNFEKIPWNFCDSGWNLKWLQFVYFRHESIELKTDYLKYNSEDSNWMPIQRQGVFINCFNYSKISIQVKDFQGSLKEWATKKSLWSSLKLNTEYKYTQFFFFCCSRMNCAENLVRMTYGFEDRNYGTQVGKKFFTIFLCKRGVKANGISYAPLPVWLMHNWEKLNAAGVSRFNDFKTWACCKSCMFTTFYDTNVTWEFWIAKFLPKNFQDSFRKRWLHLHKQVLYHGFLIVCFSDPFTVSTRAYILIFLPIHAMYSSDL